MVIITSRLFLLFSDTQQNSATFVQPTSPFHHDQQQQQQQQQQQVYGQHIMDQLRPCNAQQPATVKTVEPEPLTDLLSQDKVICNGVPTDTNHNFPPTTSGAVFPQQSTQAQSYMYLPQGEYIAANCVLNSNAICVHLLCALVLAIVRHLWTRII